jgi:hypothetical protein
MARGSQTPPDGKDPAMQSSSEEEAYVRPHLVGTGTFKTLIVEDRLLRFSDPTPVLRDSPTVAVDGLATQNLLKNLRPNIRIERTRNMTPPYYGTPVEGQRGTPTQLPADTAYTKIFDREWRRRSDNNIVESIPAVAFYGGRNAVPAHYLELLEPAPGDVSCRDYCRTAEEALRSIQGRLRLVIRNAKSEV